MRIKKELNKIIYLNENFNNLNDIRRFWHCKNKDIEKKLKAFLNPNNIFKLKFYGILFYIKRWRIFRSTK